MLQVLNDIKAEAQKLWEAGVLEVETIIKKAEEAIGMHKAATVVPNEAPSIAGIEVTEGAPADAAPSSTDPGPAA